MRILYMPIFEGGSVHDTQFAQKRGLYTALARAGHSVVELDYLFSSASIASRSHFFCLRSFIAISASSSEMPMARN